MKRRRWTVLVVPHGSAPPKSLDVTERALRRAVGIAGTAAVLLVVGMGASMSLVLRRSRNLSEALMASDAATTSDSGLQARVAALQETLDTLKARDIRMRVLAGLSPSLDSARAAAMPATPAEDVDLLIRQASVLTRSFADVTDSLARHAERFRATPSIMPTAGWLTSSFSRSRYHPILHKNRPHEGIDLSAPMGTPVVAPASGVIATVKQETGYGLIIEIDHGNGIVTKYAHLSKANVHAGQRVTRGQLIANVGNSGLSTGPHLHYEVHVNGKVVDPLTFVLPEGIPD